MPSTLKPSSAPSRDVGEDQRGDAGVLEAAAKVERVKSEVLAQPSTATWPSRASMPTAICSGQSRAASRTRSGSRTAAVPRITRVTPPRASRAPSHVADAAAELHRQRDRGEDGLDRLGVDRLAREGAVEIDHMQPLEALLGEGCAWAAGSR